MEKNMPVGVKIIAILYYIGAVFSVLLGVLAIAGAAFIGPLLTALAKDYAALAIIGRGFMIFLGVSLIILSIVGFFIGRGLWKGKNWARIVALVFAALGVISGLTSLPMGIGNILINGVIAWYLGFNKNAKDAFS